MKEKKNIDRLYQEKFREFEVSPREAVWKNVAERLEQKKRKKPLILPLWYKIGGAAAVLALVLGLTYFLNQPTSGPQVVFEDDEFETPRIEIPGLSPAFIEASENLRKITQTNNRNSTAKRSSSDENYAEATGSNRNRDSNRQNSTEKSAPSENESQTAVAGNQEEAGAEDQEELPEETKEPASLLAESISKDREITGDSLHPENKEEEEENALAQLKEQEKQEKPEELFAKVAEKSKLSLSPFAAPVYYDNMGSGNSLDPQFAGNPSKGEITMSYGIHVAYAISDKIKIRSGVGKVAMSYNIEDITYSAAMAPTAINNITYSETAHNLNIRNNNRSYNTDHGSMSLAAENYNLFSRGEINQNLGFIEIPLEIEFNLIDSRLGLNIIGGGSSLFLDDNTVSLKADNLNTKLGEANNLNNLSFSTNIGVGVDYRLTERLELNLEPIFKYQLNTFSNTPGVQPYYFGVYSGVSFKF